jgi:hypothetical protein
MHDKYFQRIDSSHLPVMLHRKMTHSSKGGYMFAIAVVFLVGALTLSLLGAIEG